MFGKNVSSFFLVIRQSRRHIACQGQETLLHYNAFHGLVLFGMLDHISGYVFSSVITLR
jgi:hypothetical protein